MCALLVPASMQPRGTAEVWQYCNGIIASVQSKLRRHAVGDEVTYSKLYGPRPPAGCDGLTAAADILCPQARCIGWHSLPLQGPVAVTAVVVQVAHCSLRRLVCC